MNQDLLIKARAYYDIIADHRPLTQPLLGQLRDYYRVGLTYSSNALEGNSLTESETKVVLEDGLTVGGKPLRDIYEATGHAKAFDFMYSIVNNRQLNLSSILTLHRYFYEHIDADKAGKFRKQPVFISGSKYPVTPEKNVPIEMEAFVDWYNDNDGKLNPIAFAAEAHKRFVFIHPFLDGNGRTARLIMNLTLLRHGYTVTIIPPILRAEYIAALEKAHTDDTDFKNLIAECVIESQKDILRLLNIGIALSDEQLRKARAAIGVEREM